MRRLAGGFTSAELVDDAAEAAPFLLLVQALLVGVRKAQLTSEPSARLLSVSYTHLTLPTILLV